MRLNRAGVPTAVATIVLVHEAEVQRCALSTLTPEQIEGRAREVATQGRQTWLGEGRRV